MRVSAIILSLGVLAIASQGSIAQGNKPVSPPGYSARDSVRAPPSSQASPKGNTDNLGSPGQQEQGTPSGAGEEGDYARQAVESGRALPLTTIIGIAEARSLGHVIDAQLLTVEGELLYRLTLLDAKGRTWREFYLARSGNPVKM